MPPSESAVPGKPPGQFFDPRLAQARKLLQAGDLQAARAINDSILAERADHCGALIQRSRLESANDNYRLAREFILSAYRAGATEKWEYLLLLRRLRIFNLVAELRELVVGMPVGIATDPEVAEAVAYSFESINETPLALEFASRAAERNPANANLQSAIGLAQLNLGSFGAAEHHLRECLRLQPGHASAWWHLVRVHKATAEANLVRELVAEIGRSHEPRSTALLGFALHRQLDELGDHAAAAQALEQACNSMRKTVRYAAEEDEKLFAALKALPNDNGGGLDPGEAPFAPVFIVGMHRSGTTLLEHLLSRHDDVCAGGEMYDFSSQLRFAADHHCDTDLDLQIVEASAGFDYTAIGKGYLDAVAWRNDGRRFLTNKLPSNFLSLGFILRALPNARVLHMSRYPMETCFSNLREPFSDTTCRYSYDQTELGGYYRMYFDLMRHWRRRFPGRIHDVNYAALATDPAAELKRACGYLGIDFQPAMLQADADTRSVNTASAVQVRQKPHLPLQPKWYPYREYLTPLSWRLADVGQK